LGAEGGGGGGIDIDIEVDMVFLGEGDRREEGGVGNGSDIVV
jgi:hypothetical protein